jgi:alpha-L-rhamnosidase
MVNTGKKCLLAFIVLFVFNGLNAQTSGGTTTIAGWTGKWIWQAANGPANTWACFRKTFNIKNIPTATTVRIAADSKYWLWVNEQLVIFEGGLKRGPTPTDTYFDQIDIAKYLKKGRNIIAIQVWHFGKNGFSHKNSGKGGLLFEYKTSDTSFVSNNTWKMKVYNAYQQTTGTSIPNYRLAEFNVRFNATIDSLNNWTSSTYDDSWWATPIEKGTPPVAPWNNLWLRPIPQWKNSGLVNYPKLSVSLPYVTTTNSVITATLPYNAQITPYLELSTNHSGALIDIRTDDYKRSGNSVRAEYVANIGNQTYESLGWMNSYCVIYTIPSGVTVKSLKY